MSALLLLVIFAALVTTLISGVRLFSAWRAHAHDRETTWATLRIRANRSNERGPIVAEQLFAMLSGAHEEASFFEWLFGRRPDRLSFEMCTQNGELTFFATVPEHLAEYVEGQLRTQYADIEIESVADYAAEIDDASAARGIELTHAAAPIYPLTTFTDSTSDTELLVTLAHALAETPHARDQIFLQIIVRPCGAAWRTSAIQCANILRRNLCIKGEGLQHAYARFFFTRHAWVRLVLLPLTILVWLRRLVTSKTLGVPPDADDTSGAAAAYRKAHKIAFEATLRIVYVPSEADRAAADAHLMTLAHTFDHYASEHGNRLTLAARGGAALFTHFHERRMADEPMILDVAELATLYHLPSHAATWPRVAYTTPTYAEEHITPTKKVDAPIANAWTESIADNESPSVTIETHTPAVTPPTFSVAPHLDDDMEKEDGAPPAPHTAAVPTFSVTPHLDDDTEIASTMSPMAHAAVPTFSITPHLDDEEDGTLLPSTTSATTSTVPTFSVTPHLDDEKETHASTTSVAISDTDGDMQAVTAVDDGDAAAWPSFLRGEAAPIEKETSHTTHDTVIPASPTQQDVRDTPPSPTTPTVTTDTQITHPTAFAPATTPMHIPSPLVPLPPTNQSPDQASMMRDVQSMTSSAMPSETPTLDKMTVSLPTQPTQQSPASATPNQTTTGLPNYPLTPGVWPAPISTSTQSPYNQATPTQPLFGTPTSPSSQLSINSSNPFQSAPLVSTHGIASESMHRATQAPTHPAPAPTAQPILSPEQQAMVEQYTIYYQQYYHLPPTHARAAALHAIHTQTPTHQASAPASHHQSFAPAAQTSADSTFNAVTNTQLRVQPQPMNPSRPVATSPHPTSAKRTFTPPKPTRTSASRTTTAEQPSRSARAAPKRALTPRTSHFTPPTVHPTTSPHSASPKKMMPRFTPTPHRAAPVTPSRIVSTPAPKPPTRTTPSSIAHKKPNSKRHTAPPPPRN